MGKRRAEVGGETRVLLMQHVSHSASCQLNHLENFLIWRNQSVCRNISWRNLKNKFPTGKLDRTSSKGRVTIDWEPFKEASILIFTLPAQRLKWPARTGRSLESWWFTIPGKENRMFLLFISVDVITQQWANILYLVASIIVLPPMGEVHLILLCY